MNNNLNFQFRMYEPSTTPLSSIPARTQFLLYVVRNVISLLSLIVLLILYIYTGWQRKPSAICQTGIERKRIAGLCGCYE